MKSGIKISFSIVAILSVLFSFNQCVAEKKGASKATIKTAANAPSPETGNGGEIDEGNDLPGGLTMPPMNNPTTPSDKDEIDVGVKNFEQISISMATVTGVSPADAGVSNLYKQLSSQLPADNNVQSIAPANQMAIIKLASEYCDRLVESTTLRAVVWPGINLTQTPTALFTSANKTLIINLTMTQFLPPLQPSELAETKDELSKLFDELLVGEPLNSAATSRKVVKGLCIANLASAHTTLL
jgi:hypothetical protein